MTAPPPANTRLISIQFLRFVSALWVVALHQAFAFGEYMGAGLGLDRLWEPGNHVGNIAVCGFFIISGYIMVYTSRDLFGQPGARRLFWTRRVVRVFPPYWLATLLLVALLIVLRGQDVAGPALLQSLLLIPYWSGEPFTLTVPIMWVGWTLFFEMVFYFLFGLFVAFRRPLAIALTIAALVLLVVSGVVFDPQSAPFWMATRPVALVFIAGMLIALWRERGGSMRWPTRIVLMLLAAASAILVPLPEHYGPTTWGYLSWAALPAILFSLGLFGGETHWPRPALVDRLGDISFALYLLHVPAAHFWTVVWQNLQPPGGAWGFMVTLVIGTVIASWLAFIWIERPMTRWLNRKLGAARAQTAS